MFSHLFRKFVCYAADEGGSGAGGGAASGTAAPSAPATPSAASPPPSATPSSTPASPGGSVPAGAASLPAGTPAPPAAPSWLEAAKQHNLPVGKDENETFALLKRMHDERHAFEQVRPLLPHVQAYLADAQKYNAWKQEQAKAVQTPQPGKPNDPWWKEHWQPPEYNQAWLQQITRDEKGNLIPVPGAPPDVVMKIQAYEQFRRDQTEKFLANPYEFMAPMQQQMEARARAIAQEEMQRMTGGTRDQQSAQSFIEQNQSWLFEMDPETKALKQQQVIDPATGQWRMTEVLSPWGQRMQQYAEAVRKQQETRGYHDQQEIQQVAYARVQADFAAWQQQELLQGRVPAHLAGKIQVSVLGVTPAAPAAPTLTPQEQANKDFLDKNNPAGVGGKKGAPAAETPITRKNFRYEMAKAFKQAGLIKETINQ